MQQATSHTANDRHVWVFDWPVWSDGMFWQGLVLGLVFAFFETSSMGFPDQSLLGQALDLLGAVLVGMAIVGVVGGTVRWFLRGYRNSD